MSALRLPKALYDEVVKQCLDAYPLEGCGLFGVAAGTSTVSDIYPARNAAASAKVYSVDSMDLLKADRSAEAAGLELGGVFHSHTHTEAYPSPTDVAQAPDPNWHYVIVSLAQPEADLQSFRIIDGKIEAEPIVVE